jgi:hypothetical protein
MGARGLRFGVVAAWVLVMGAGPVAGQEAVPAPVPGSAPVPVPVPAPVPVPVPVKESVLVAPVQGSEALWVEHGERIAAAVRRALGARGYRVPSSQELLGRAVIACQTPECVEGALDAAGAAFAIVPAIWSRESGGEELTLTLVQRRGGNLNASGVVGDDLVGLAEGLVDELLVRRGSATAAVTGSASAAASAAASRGGHPHAWKAGPITLIVGGVAAIVAVGVGAGVKSDTQQLNGVAVGAWSVIGAAAIAGGITWWVIGEKRRRQRAGRANSLTPAIAFQPAGIDLRLRF